MSRRIGSVARTVVRQSRRSRFAKRNSAGGVTRRAAGRTGRTVAGEHVRPDDQRRGSNVGTTQAVVEGFRTFHATLESEHLSISGVSIDEEAINMLAFQRAFQASARVIKTIDELLEVLVNL